MPAEPEPELQRRPILDPGELSARARYELLTSLVVPRPIGWVGTASTDRVPNLAPFSFFSALSATPMLVGLVIVPRRNGIPKDSLANIRARSWFSVNVVTTPQLERMNRTSADLAPDVDEFRFGEVPMAWPEDVQAPFVADAPAVLVCRALREIDLEPSASSMVVGQVEQVRLAEDLEFEPGSHRVRPDLLPAVGRLGGSSYVLPGPLVELARPRPPGA